MNVPFVRTLGEVRPPIFGVAGTHVMRFLKFLSEHGLSDLYRPAGTELGAGFSAVGWSRVTGKASLCLLTPGPGFLIGAAAIHEAAQKGTPVIFLVGDIPKEHREGRGKSLHELLPQGDIARLLTGAYFRVTSPRDGDSILRKCLEFATRVPRRPAVLEVPVDILTPYAGEEGSVDFHHNEPPPDEDRTGEALRLLKESRSPAVLAGYGCFTPPVSGLVEKLCGSLEAPLFTTVSGKGIVSEEREWVSVLTPSVAKGVLEEADLLIVLGSVLSYSSTFNRSIRLPEKVVVVSAGGEEISYPGREVLRVRVTVERFIEQVLGEKIEKSSSIREKLSENRKRLEERARESFPREMEYVSVLERAVPEGDLLFTDPTILSYWMRYFFRVRTPGSYHYPWGTNSLGFAVPGLRGAITAKPGKRGTVVTGDGNLPYSLQEINLAARENIPATIIVINDGGYGVLRDWRGWKGASPLGVDLPPLPLEAFCRDAGVEYNRATSPEELSAALSGRGRGGTRIVEVFDRLRPPWSVL
ncbi:MAG: thiamine pyrophosphate-binding protein [Deltaproteobacteria bacterium]|nr:MAG: thiamine pyrophosphate-binding protein [Deltaproteobacteria bacterium]